MDDEITVQQYAERFEKSAEHVRQCCRQDVIKGKKQKLRDGWKARKVGSNWWLSENKQQVLPSDPEPDIDYKSLVSDEVAELFDKNFSVSEAAYRKAKFPSDLRFHAIRCRVIEALVLAPKPRKRRPALQQDKASYERAAQIVEHLLNLTSDNELYEELARRWKGDPRSDETDIQRYLAFQKSNKSKEDRPSLSTSLFNKSFQEPGLFFTKLKEAYHFAQLGQRSVAVEVEFNSDGSFKINGTKLDELSVVDRHLNSRDVIDKKGKDLLNNIESLYELAWHVQIDKKAKAKGRLDQNWLDSLLDTPFFQTHPFASDFKNRCICCGLQKKQLRAKKLYLNNSCRNRQQAWVEKQVKFLKQENGEEIVDKEVRARVLEITNNLKADIT